VDAVGAHRRGPGARRRDERRGSLRTGPEAAPVGLARTLTRASSRRCHSVRYRSRGASKVARHVRTRRLMALRCVRRLTTRA
jgi:hypothetical protein